MQQTRQWGQNFSQKNRKRSEKSCLSMLKKRIHEWKWRTEISLRVCGQELTRASMLMSLRQRKSMSSDWPGFTFLRQDSQTTKPFELLTKLRGWQQFCRNKRLLKNQTNLTVRWFTVPHDAFCKYLNFPLFSVFTTTALVLFFGFIVCDVTATRFCLFTVSDMNLRRSAPFTGETNAQTSAPLAPLTPSAG